MVGTRRTQVARKQINRISKSPHPRTPKRATNQRCVSPVIESRTPQISMSRVSTSRSSSSDGEPEFDLDTVLKSVKQKLVDLKFNVPTLTKHLEPHCENLTTLLTRCADLKESNSILIEGPVGSGKRGLVRNAIARFEQSRKSSKNQNSVKFVTLNGTVISDVKSCLREISRQLLTNKSKHEQLLRDLNDENADSDLDGENMDCDAQESNSMLTVGKSLSFLLSTLQETRNTDGQSLVFILEGFEHFVQSKSQMLLYNLFDTCQSFRTPLVVIAVSNRLDSTELLEKRVKSRFSHRSITLWNDLSFDQWIQCAKDLLKVEPLSKRDSGRNSWNKSVDNLLKNDKVLITLERLHSTFPVINCLKAALLRFIVSCSLKENHGFDIFLDAVETSCNKVLEGSHSLIYKNISLCELIMVAAMAKIVKRVDDPCEEVTFAAIYQEYSTFAKRNSSYRKIDRTMAMNSFDSLMQLKIVAGCNLQAKYSGKGGTMKAFRKFRLMLDVCQIDDIVTKHPACPSNVRMWALNKSDN